MNESQKSKITPLTMDKITAMGARQNTTTTIETTQKQQKSTTSEELPKVMYQRNITDTSQEKIMYPSKATETKMIITKQAIPQDIEQKAIEITSNIMNNADY